MTDLLAHPFAIYLLCLPATLIYNLFDPDGLGTTVLGGWSIFNYLGFFVAGFLVISNSRLQANIARMRWVSFAVGFFAWPMVDVVWNALGKPAFGTPQFALGTLFYCLFAWCWLLAIFGFAFRYLNHDKPFVRYANEAVLPFYILHQTVLLLIAFYVVRWNIPDVAKFFIILIASFGITMSIYELLIRRHNLLRILFGMKLLTRTASIPAVESQAAAPARSL
jgi:hypothetical protein